MCYCCFLGNIPGCSFNPMSRTNETRHIKWHKTRKCKCRLDGSVCNNNNNNKNNNNINKKHDWNDDKCRCECKELIDKVACDKGYACNPMSCEFECDKPCDVGEYKDYKKCKCGKRMVDKLVEECSENIDEEKLSEIALFEHGNECVCSYRVCIVLGVIALTIYIGTGAYFTNKYINHKKENVSHTKNY